MVLLAGCFTGLQKTGLCYKLVPVEITTAVCARVFHMDQMAESTWETLSINCLGADSHPNPVQMLTTVAVQRCRTLQHISAPMNTSYQHT